MRGTRLINLKGKIFDRLTVLERYEGEISSNQHSAFWLCQCTCGTIKPINGRRLRNGETTSCGCKRTERNRENKMEKHPQWKGGKITSHGYKMVMNHDHPNSQKSGYVFEHIVVMTEYLGVAALLPEENVHHINGVRDDNRIENLELWNHSQPSGQRVTDKVEFAKKILRRYLTKEELVNWGNSVE